MLAAQAMKPNLVTLEVLPFGKQTFSPLSLLIVETPLVVWLCTLPQHYIQLLLQTQDGDSGEELEVAQNEIRRIGWLGEGWNLVLHQKLLHCDEGVSRHIVIVQDTVVSQFYRHFLPSSILRMLQNFDMKIRMTVLSYRDTLMVLQT